MATDVRTMNLSDNGDGMVSLNNNQGTSFVPNIPPEKNVSENKQTMDSTSISDIMGQAEEPLEPPMMSADPRMDANAYASSNDDGATTTSRTTND